MVTNLTTYSYKDYKGLSAFSHFQMQANPFQSCQCFDFLFSLLQEAALKTFHISDDPKNYYVTEASEIGKTVTLFNPFPYNPDFNNPEKEGF